MNIKKKLPQRVKDGLKIKLQKSVTVLYIKCLIKSVTQYGEQFVCEIQS